MASSTSDVGGELITVQNIDSVDPTSLVGDQLKRYHHLKRYRQMMKQADDAQAANRTASERRAQEELERNRRELLQLQRLEGARLAREAVEGMPVSLTLAYRNGGGAKSTIIFSRWSSRWRADHRKALQLLRRRAKAKRWNVEAKDIRAKEEQESEAQKQKQLELTKRRVQAEQRESKRRARAQFLQHKPGNPFAVWEVQDGLPSDRNQGWTAVPEHLNTQLELAFVREHGVVKFTSNGQLCIAKFKGMDIENAISQRFTPMRRRLRNSRRLQQEQERQAARGAQDHGALQLPPLPHMNKQTKSSSGSVV